MKQLRIAALAAAVPLTLTLPAALAAQTAVDSLRIFYVGRPVGWEVDTIVRGNARDAGVTLASDFSYVDRGRRIHTTSTMIAGSDYTPRTLDVFRASDTSRTPLVAVRFDGRSATITRNGAQTSVVLPARAFALSQYTPVAQHLALIRYWKAHGRPDTIAIVPGNPNRVAIRLAGSDMVDVGNGRASLDRYTIDGVVWGREYLWVDGDDRLAMFASAAGGLSTKAIGARYLPSETQLMDIASRSAISDLQTSSKRATVTAAGTIAIVGATLVDGTGRPAVSNAVVVTRGGKIVAAGPAAAVAIPKDARRVDATGKTIIPGLWDMHAHLHQQEWLPVYLAAGVTTVRDMGNELPFITGLRKATADGSIRGPRIVAAGLIDGPGPNAFGAYSASTPEEGRTIVRMYHSLGFEQMKLYSLLSPAVVGAVCDEAHKLGMTVTGHIPNSLTLLAAVDSGMDHVAHLPLRGDPATDTTLRATIAHLKAKGTVVDPTESWNEIGGHSTAEPLESFQPVTSHVPATFMQFRVANWGANVDTATAHKRLAGTLAIIGALYNAGVPIVAGTDEGVPGFSVYREMELYVKAGMTPMDALRSATAVPAKAMRLDGETGTIEPGKRADLLVLDANPLDDISNVRRVRSVMQAGAMYDPASLWRIAGFIP